MTKAINNIGNNAQQYLCEFSSNPSDECYCRKVTGMTVPFITKYCMDSYRKCEVYKRLLKGNKGGHVAIQESISLETK